MIELNRHIEILLLHNDCVIIPGFGGFMAHHVEAHFDGADDMFLPPYRTIGFNPNLTINDSLLAQSYVDVYDLSYPEAVRRIESEVNELQRRIDNEGEYEFNSIGIITRNAEGNYSFEPYEGGILTPEFYGLSGFEFPKLATRPQLQHHESPTAITMPITAASGKADTQESKEEDANQGTYMRLQWARYAAAIVLAVMTFFLLPEQIGTHSTEATPKLNISLLQHIMPSMVTIDPVRQEATPTENAEEPTAIVSEEPMQEASAEPEDYYCVVLASQVSDKNAKAFLGRLAKRGIRDARVMDCSSGNKVVVGYYADEHEAANVKRQMSRYSETADCWVMHVKP